jgi:hypothetical protein
MRKNDAMNAEETLDHAFGCLEAHEREEFEGRLRSDPVLAERFERLNASIVRLLDDGLTHDPPAGLAGRTAAFVAQAKTRTPPHPFPEHSTGRSSIRWADVAVAASIFFVGVLTILPLLQYARDRRNHLACALNLHQIGQKLALYASSHQSYPFPARDHMDDPAGIFAVMLHDDGLLPDLAVLDCPYNGVREQPVNQLPRYDDLDTIRRTDPERFRRLVGLSDYAYHVGYRHPTGQVGPLERLHAGAIPLIADKPDHDAEHAVMPGNSPNHGRLGQNVLFSDGGVKWLKSRFVSAQDPDIFLNNDMLPRPGIHAQDSVLLPSHTPFKGN